MENKETTDTWLYIIIRDPNTSSEQFVGFSDEKTNEKFLPAFKTKQDAKACFAMLPKDVFNGKYEVHAVIKEDVMNTAEDQGHKVFLLDEEGNILKQLG